MVWILVVSPPRERPMAWSSPSFLGAGAVLVRAYAGRVDEHVLGIGMKGQCFENAGKNTAFAPYAQALVRRLPVAVSLRQIAPRYAGSCPINNGVDKQAVIGRRAADVPLPQGNRLRNHLAV